MRQGLIMVLLAMAVLAGCSSAAARRAPAWTPAQMVGNWSAPGGGSIRLHADGTFEEAGVPRAVLPGSAAAQGTWELRRDAVGAYVNLVRAGTADGSHGTLIPERKPGRSSLCYFDDDLAKPTDACDLEYVRTR